MPGHARGRYIQQHDADFMEIIRSLVFGCDRKLHCEAKITANCGLLYYADTHSAMTTFVKSVASRNWHCFFETRCRGIQDEVAAICIDEKSKMDMAR